MYRNLEGKKGYGYLATVLPAVCKVYLDADRDGAIWKSQKHIVEACRVLHESLADVAIIALVDEATGYQYERPRMELQEFLALYINKKLARWVSTFPPAFPIVYFITNRDRVAHFRLLIISIGHFTEHGIAVIAEV